MSVRFAQTGNIRLPFQAEGKSLGLIVSINRTLTAAFERLAVGYDTTELDEPTLACNKEMRTC